jgi:hypothetical protein
VVQATAATGATLTITIPAMKVVVPVQGFSANMAPASTPSPTSPVAIPAPAMQPAPPVVQAAAIDVPTAPRQLSSATVDEGTCAASHPTHVPPPLFCPRTPVHGPDEIATDAPTVPLPVRRVSNEAPAAKPTGQSPIGTITDAYGVDSMSADAQCRRSEPFTAPALQPPGTTAAVPRATDAGHHSLPCYEEELPPPCWPRSAD